MTANRFNFRAWDGERMHTPAYPFGTDKARYVSEPMSIDHIYKMKPNYFRITEGRALMQSTGLTDKNGVEIFEGDVVQFKYGGIRKIGWGTSYSPEEGGALGFVAQYFNGDHAGESVQYGDHIEVIGNIYEHPELLEGK